MVTSSQQRLQDLESRFMELQLAVGVEVLAGIPELDRDTFGDGRDVEDSLGRDHRRGRGDGPLPRERGHGCRDPGSRGDEDERNGGEDADAPSHRFVPVTSVGCEEVPVL